MRNDVYVSERNMERMHVVSDQGRWAVFREGSQRAYKICDNKTEAIEIAKVLVRRKSLGDIVVHKKDGSVEIRIKSDIEGSIPR
jgi:hypothetical protein